jgi:acyl-CoA thioesterase
VGYQAMIEERNRINPFAQYLGIKLTRMSAGYAEAQMTISLNSLNPLGNAHGGCLYSIADVVAGAVAASMGFHAVTITGNYQYLHPIKCNDVVKAVGRAMKSGRALVVTDVEIYSREGKIVGKGTFTHFKLESD